MSSIRVLPFPETPITKRLCSRVNFDDPTGCWLWTGTTRGTHPLMYGVMKANGQTWSVHRLSYTLANGPIPDGLLVCHRCDTPLCIRPDHLFLGTHADNMRDCWEKGRHSVLRGEDNGNHQLSEEQVIDIRERFASGHIDQTTIAKEHGVARSLIGMIVRGEIWQHAGGPRTTAPFPKSNTGYRGVSFSRAHGNRYQVYINHKGKRHALGIVDDAVIGARMYDEAAKRLHGEKAILNFPD